MPEFQLHYTYNYTLYIHHTYNKASKHPSAFRANQIFDVNRGTSINWLKGHVSEWSNIFVE